MTVETVRPRSWGQLLDTLFGGSWNHALGRFRTPYAFRGQACAGEPLSSGLVRLAAGRDVRRLEQHLLRNFRKYAFSRATRHDSVWYWLALGQHRGLPTRLLDWTYSPLVALHFATASLSTMQEDGVVWAVNFVETNRHLPRRLRDLLQGEGSDTATLDMLSAFTSVAAFDRLAKRPFVIFLEPPSLDPRIVNQFALFSLMSDPAVTLEGWLSRHHRLARRVIVPAALKWEIRDKLDQANINERVLFPGLDGLTRWLTRYYWRNPRRSGRAGEQQAVLVERALRRGGRPAAVRREP